LNCRIKRINTKIINKNNKEVMIQGPPSNLITLKMEMGVVLVLNYKVTKTIHFNKKIKIATVVEKKIKGKNIIILF
jgi:hypothetical protein